MKEKFLGILQIETKTSSNPEFWQKRLHAARSWRESHWNGEKAWQLGYRLNKGHHWSTPRNSPDHLYSDRPNDKISVNLTGSTVQDFLPFLTKKEPEFYAKPKKEGISIANARNMTLALNYVFHEFNMNTQMRLAVLDGIITGHGIVETGFKLEIDESVKPDEFGKVEYDTAVRAEYPWVKRINPLHFFFDPDAPDHTMNSSRWVAKLVFKPLQDVVTSSKYNKTLINKIKAGSVTPTTVSSYLANTEGGMGDLKADLMTDQEMYAQTKVVLWEVWDRKFQRYLIILDGATEEFLFEDSWLYDYLDGFPFLMWDFITVPNEHYPLGLPSFVLDQQLELNRIRTFEYNHRRMNTTKYQAPKEGMDAGELEKFVSGKDFEVILHNGMAGEQVITPIQSINIPGDHLQVEELIKRDFRELAGQDELMRGGNLPSRTSATEIQARQEVAGKKLENRIDNVNLFYSEVGKQLSQHLKAQMKKDIFIRMVGEKFAGEYEFLRMSSENIQGDFDISVRSVAGPQIDPIVDRQQRLELWKIFSANAAIFAQMGVPVNWAEMIRWLLEAFDEKDISRFFPLAGEPYNYAIVTPPGLNFASGQPGPASTSLPGDPSASAMAAQASPDISAMMGGLFGGMSGGVNTPGG